MLDLVHRKLGALHGDDDRGPQARLAVKPFASHPPVEGARNARRHVLAEKRLHAIKTVADREARLPGIEGLRPHLVKRARGLSLRRAANPGAP